MEYTIDLDSLDGKSTTLSSISTNINSTVSTSESKLNKYSGTEISSLINKATTCLKRMDTGTKNAYNWFENYLDDIKNLESNLASFSGDLDAPKEFNYVFTDLFSKVTVPAIKTGGNRTINLQLGPGTLGKTQAKEFYALGDKAWNSDSSAIAEWVEKVGKIVKNTNTYGMKKSLIIAQIINESGWMSTHASSLSNFNNVLGINTDMGRITPDMQDSTWSKKRTSGNNNVTQWSADGSHVVGTNESMRHYDSIEECIEDYANVLSLYHPELKGDNNLLHYKGFLDGYTPNPHESVYYKYNRIINNYNLERFDV